MAGRRRRARQADAECGGGCEQGGHCVWAGGRRACVCAGPWGGARCTLYVGHDHACAARACPPPALCVWGPDLGPATPGATYCACLEGASCTAPHALTPAPADAGAPPPRPGSGGAWAGGVVALLCLVVAVLGALYALRRRRHGAFVHARLADNVEINNPMYLAGEDELDPPHHNHMHNNGGNHFANPVYDTMYAAPHAAPAEEQANLLQAGAGAGAGDGAREQERAALL